MKWWCKIADLRGVRERSSAELAANRDALSPYLTARPRQAKVFHMFRRETLLPARGLFRASAHAPRGDTARASLSVQEIQPEISVIIEE